VAEPNRLEGLVRPDLLCLLYRLLGEDRHRDGQETRVLVELGVSGEIPYQVSPPLFPLPIEV